MSKDAGCNLIDAPLPDITHLLDHPNIPMNNTTLHVTGNILDGLMSLALGSHSVAIYML